MRAPGSSEHGQKADAVERVFGVGRHARRLEEGRHPVHRDRELGSGAAPGHAPGPADDVGHADAALEQVHLLAHQRPGVGVALPAVVAGEDHERIVRRAGRGERGQDAADALVHVADHRQVRLDGAAVGVGDLVQPAGHGLVIARLPGPVRRRVVDRQEEGRLASALPADEVHGALGDEIGEIPDGMGFRLALEEVVLPGGVAVGEVVEAAAHRAEELPVAALQRSEVRQEAEVPLADQGRRVAGVAQQRGQRRVVRRQAQHRIAAVAARDRLVVAAAQPVLEAPGHQREARGRADRRVGVPVGEAQAVGGQTVELGGARRPAAVTAEVRIAEVVGEDEDEVGPHRAADPAEPRVQFACTNDLP